MPDKLSRSPLVSLSQELEAHTRVKMVNQCSLAVEKQQKQQQQQQQQQQQKQQTGAGKQKSAAAGGRAGQVSLIMEGLYLSGARAVRQARLTELGVTCVINSTVELPVVPLDGMEVIPVRVHDTPTSDLAAHLDDISDRIEDERRRGGRVLVHCVAGVSRSPALVLAYLVKYADMSLRQAFLHVRSTRPNVRPNAGFFSQLIEFERRVRGSTTVSLVQDPELGLTIPDVCEDELKILRDTRWGRMIHERRNFQRLYA